MGLQGQFLVNFLVLVRRLSIYISTSPQSPWSLINTSQLRLILDLHAFVFLNYFVQLFIDKYFCCTQSSDVPITKLLTGLFPLSN